MMWRMQTMGHPNQVAAGGPHKVWHWPSMAVPRGRRPGLRADPGAYVCACAPGFAMASGVFAYSEAQLVRLGQPLAVASPAMVIIPGLFAYGFALVATARRGTPLIPTPLGYGSGASSRLWLGLAMVLPALLAVLGATFVLRSPDQGRWFLLVSISPLVVAVACLIVGYVVAMRPVRAAILAGRAPTYVTSPNRQWWWDGTYWFGVSSAVPPRALRSPDGNYWWTGEGWSPMPPLPPKKPRG